MSNKPENRIEDRRVTDSYRALARERTPDQLNEKILKMAAGGRTPYARARAWMRPAAWAATIGLSFAIVLELTQLQSMDPDYVGISSTADDAPTESPKVLSDDVADPVRPFAPESSLPASIEQAEPSVGPERKRLAQPAVRAADSLAKQEFEPRETTAMQNAEDLARAQAGSNRRDEADLMEAGDVLPESRDNEHMSAELAAERHDKENRLAARQVSIEARGAAASLAAVSAEKKSDPPCPASERSAPDAWLACIRELRDSGQNEQADAEYKEFRQVFPDFDDSDTDK